MDELLNEEIIDATRVVLDLVSEGGHLLRPAAVDGSKVLLRVGAAVVLQLQLRVRRDNRQLLQVLPTGIHEEFSREPR